MKKILIVGNYTKSIGGISGQIEILLKRLPECGFDVELFNYKAGFIKRLFLFVRLLFKGKRFDIFHLHGCSFFGFLPIIVGVFAARVLHKKVIVTYHGGGLEEFMLKYKCFILFVLRKANLVTVPSDYLYQQLINKNVKVIVLPNIIRADNVKFTLRNVFRPFFIVTRSLEDTYNVELAINAFGLIKKDHPSAKLFLVGDGSRKQQLEELVMKKKITDVEFVGRVSNSDIGSYLNKADIYINPTRKDSFSVSLFEAIACGLPVVSSSVGAIPGFIKDYENGLLFESDNLDQLVEKLTFVLKNKTETMLMVRSAYKLFESHTWEKQRNTYINMLEATV